ncbi:hypothetical protein LTR99_000209 [Exophiala xenobiotica]|uniref:Histidinol-phosphatase n=1 Tax=Vermiconidia calcicola TaxID=1690605 RepID=A0AAV9PUN8_9PEZI|nr:hypothetical protein LTR92_003367 [Exophiala xenobiotica]KAK5529982.1 hypothetical protein LTR25_009226 [Vermiconidia calcicola]KAK5547301.1 hypothetical protein LTR23_002521 [Chaetothyriales sp. CCFEE 6169]KAK5231473.1 hypothetical protein LTR72_000655 [Exophiala xenobiotica]KAK5232572.1 hypothetical protein LTR47_006460 [Exophiala xenobiotica]
MPFSHHSHSGQFCPGHARDSLEDIINLAISKRMQVLALTEHMPRHDEDRYPEEIEAGVTLASHYSNESAYFAEANRLREQYKDQIDLLVGFEGEWIRPESADLVKRSISTYQYDFFIGSVHHMHTIPIDYDREMYEKARHVSGGTDARLFEDYFDQQLAMLRALQPPVVGHFDLIRLKSDSPNGSFQNMSGVWDRILRSLDYIASYGGILEINSASLRKGMDEPYPKAEICQAALERNIRFCLSDDSHGLDQVGLNYGRVLPFLEEIGLTLVTFLRNDGSQQEESDSRFPRLRCDYVELRELRNHAFWDVS